jgi:hypothetical protein
MATALIGKDGWLFLDSDTNGAWDQYEGKRLLDAGKLEAWREELAKRRKLMDDRGCPYRFVVGPNREMIYSEYVPAPYVKGEFTIMDQMRSLLDESVDWVDLHKLFAGREDRDDLYFKNDTHWNQLGGWVASNEIIDSLRAAGLAIAPILADEVARTLRSGVGDLGNKFDPPIFYPRPDGAMRAPRSKRVFDNGINNHGRIVIYENNECAGPSIVVFGDSFAGAIVYWLRERCRRLVRAHTSSIDSEILEIEQPNAVISINVERFLFRPPVPCDLYSIRSDINGKVQKMREMGESVTPIDEAMAGSGNRQYAAMLNSAIAATAPGADETPQISAG